MPSLQIRSLPEDVYEALAFRAARARRSLAQQALVELAGDAMGASIGRRRRILERIKLSMSLTSGMLPAAPEQLIRDDRER
ncbi:MAG: hypothetical protein EYC67_14110 [Betaproteobacteria bacterium]|nr:MAG: hypothetical protein EYC67_14110 [Betaproteobacteria bacterium]